MRIFLILMGGCAPSTFRHARNLRVRARPVLKISEFFRNLGEIGVKFLNSRGPKIQNFGKGWGTIPPNLGANRGGVVHTSRIWHQRWGWWWPFSLPCEGVRYAHDHSLGGSIPTFSTRVWEGTATKSFALNGGGTWWR